MTKLTDEQIQKWVCDFLQTHPGESYSSQELWIKICEQENFISSVEMRIAIGNLLEQGKIRFNSMRKYEAYGVIDKKRKFKILTKDGHEVNTGSQVYEISYSDFTIKSIKASYVSISFYEDMCERMERDSYVEHKWFQSLDEAYLTIKEHANKRFQATLTDLDKNYIKFKEPETVTI